MPDLNQMSDEELRALVQQKMQGQSPSLGGGGPRAEDPYGSVSDEELNKLVHAKIREKTAPLTFSPNAGDENVSSEDLYKRYQGARSQAKQDPYDLSGIRNSVTTENKMPDDVSLYHRAVVENFSNNPWSSIKYLAERYPDYDVAHDGNHIVMRKKGGGDWRPLDPKTDLSDAFTHPLDTLKRGAENISDIAAPAAEGVAANVPGDVAGAAIAMTPAAPAAIPAAAAINYGAGTGLDALRQKIGNWLGLDQDVNWKDANLSGATSAAGPLLFGTGGSAAKIAEGAAEKGLSEDAAAAAIKWQKGAIPAVAPKVAALASGTPKETISTAYNRLPELKQLEQEGISPLAMASQEELKNKLGKVATAYGQKIGEGIDNSKQAVDISGVKTEWKAWISKLEDNVAKAPTEANKAELDAAKNQYNSMFQMQMPGEEPSSLLDAKGLPVSSGSPPMSAELPDKVSGTTAFQLMHQMKEVADLGKHKAGIIASNEGKPLSTKALEGKAASSYGELSNQIDQVLAKDGNEGLRENFRQVKTIQRELQPYFSDPNKAYNTLRTLDSPSKQRLYETLSSVDKNFGTNTVKDAKLLDAYSNFGRKNPISGDLMSKRKIPLALAGGGAGYWAGSEMGDGHSKAVSVPMGILGMGIGTMLAGPRALRYYMGASKAAAKTLPYTTAPTWDMMHSQYEQNNLERSPQ
jgi:hypothetical protein